MLRESGCPENGPVAGRVVLGPSRWRPRKDAQSYCCGRRLMGVKNDEYNSRRVHEVSRDGEDARVSE